MAADQPGWARVLRARLFVQAANAKLLAAGYKKRAMSDFKDRVRKKRREVQAGCYAARYQERFFDLPCDQKDRHPLWQLHVKPAFFQSDKFIETVSGSTAEFGWLSAGQREGVGRALDRLRRKGCAFFIPTIEVDKESIGVRFANVEVGSMLSEQETQFASAEILAAMSDANVDVTFTEGLLIVVPREVSSLVFSIKGATMKGLMKGTARSSPI